MAPAGLALQVGWSHLFDNSSARWPAQLSRKTIERERALHAIHPDPVFDREDAANRADERDAQRSNPSCRRNLQFVAGL